MELVSSIWDITTRLWECSASRVAYVTDLKEILASLKREMEDLTAIREDVKLRLRVAEEQGMMPKSQVTGWLRRVDAIEEVVNEILQHGGADDHVQDGNNSTTGLGEGPPPGVRSAYKLGKKASKTLKVVEELRSKGGEFQDVANQRPLSAFSEMPMEKTLGMESTLEDVLEKLKDDTVGIIGLYGMGGVGKTTLLKRINNELPQRGVFDVAIWVVASKQATLEAVQQDILGKLHIPYNLWIGKPTYEKATFINQFLKGKRYVLMLDDLWERLDLSEMGIPLPSDENKCKIIFTTRSEEVCGLMEAHAKIKVRCLPWEKAWALFQEKVGNATLTSHYLIPRLAKMVARECDGLPLVLITIGRAMASRKTHSEWSHALEMLQKNPSRFSGMGDRVLPILKFSYDSLPDPTIKACFIYCSMFPEDYEIPTNKLVDLWIGEGYLKEFDDIFEARNHGLYIIESLKLACLLESGISHSRVKMHDVVRDMALWIASECGEQNSSKFIILDRAENSIQNWDQVEKISLWGDMIEEPVLTSLCSKLCTLVVNDTLLREIPVQIFSYVPTVRVLDLSGNKSLKKLPKEISHLTCLEYLDLSRTRIEDLPECLRCSNRLRHLLLNYIKLNECPTNIISCLVNLWVFRLNFGRKYPVAFLKALERLPQIKEMSIYMHSSNTLNFFLNSNKLQRVVRYLRIDRCIETESIPLSLTNMKNLEALQIYDCSCLGIMRVPTKNASGVYHSISTKEAYFCNLRHVIIYRCDHLQSLDILVYAPCLENLWVSECKSLKVIYPDNPDCAEDSHTVFPSLRKIRLAHLPYLLAFIMCHCLFLFWKRFMLRSASVCGGFLLIVALPTTVYGLLREKIDGGLSYGGKVIASSNTLLNILRAELIPSLKP